MRLADLVAAVYGAFDAPAAMADVEALCRHDRYQASAGIDAAAGHVAERAAGAGLADVEILRFPADGARRWWTFAAPLSWTPRRASVALDGVPLLRYPEQPYALAAYSAPAPPGRVPLVRWSASGGRPGARSALVVLDGVPLPAALGDLVAHGAAGAAADPLAGRPRLPDQVGRIELPAGGPLFAFSATAEQLRTLAQAADRGASAHVTVEVDAGAGTLPVVTGRLPATHGPDDREVLLSAHLCHPRPSANDNASGVAALLGIARAYRRLPRDAGAAVRFVWGPEFVGLAAYLHDVVHAGRGPRPVAAVNVDMAGEDQRRCGGPLIIERAPDELPSPVPAIAERCAALIPAPARSYSGAVPVDTWAWRATPYAGASDHAMLAGRPTSCPAISLGHWPDTANHTSADTLDLVDPAELRRTATIAGATIAALRALDARADAELAADVTDAVLAWAAHHVLSALPGARPQPPSAPAPAGDPQAPRNAARSQPLSPPAPAGDPQAARPQPPSVFDPWAPEQAGRLLEHRATVAVETVRALGDDRATGWITGLAAHAGTRVPQAVEPPASGEVLAPCWDGPMNLRHLTECAAADDRRWLAEVTAHDRGGGYARLLALARGVDGRRDTTAVAWWAALTSELAIPVALAQRFLRILADTGWARPNPEPSDLPSHPHGDGTSSARRTRGHVRC